ncbi:MAG: hypothetical protein CFE43_18775 [Burkholderiales bacterium PBB3]|nr:MAG: hypothetical protein CFE43_18775 [Burkholderiales bacterium PBB3]
MTTPHSPLEIRAFIFDLFGVVLSFDENSVYTRLAAQCHEPATALQALQGLVSTPALITGKLSLQQLHQQLVAKHGFSLGFAQFEVLWLTPYTAAMPGIAGILRALSSRYRLVLLSNVDCYYLEVVRRQHPELSYFADQLVSCELGYAKPDDAAFFAALRAAEFPPEACYFVDDKVENIEAAARLGIRGHAFSSAASLSAALLLEGIAVGESDRH